MENDRETQPATPAQIRARGENWASFQAHGALGHLQVLLLRGTYRPDDHEDLVAAVAALNRIVGRHHARRLEKALALEAKAETP